CIVIVFWMLFVFFFFFSSRRRHTRSKRDWSSDVCSSDLTCARIIGPGMQLWIAGAFTGAIMRAQVRLIEIVLICFLNVRHRRLRSEERRVGKECRFRLWP